MMAELKEMKPGAMSVAQNLSHMILAQALRLHLQTENERDVGWFAALSDPRIGKAMEAMHSEPSRPWDSGSPSRQCRYVTLEFRRSFPKTRW